MERGKYRLYQCDPEKPIPRTTRWRMKSSADGATSSTRDLLRDRLSHFSGESSDNTPQLKRRKLYNCDPTQKIPRQTAWYFKKTNGGTSVLGEDDRLAGYDPDILTPTLLDSSGSGSEGDTDGDGLLSTHSNSDPDIIAPTQLDTSDSDSDDDDLLESDTDDEASLLTTNLDIGDSDSDSDIDTGGTLFDGTDSDESGEENVLQPLGGASDPLYCGAPLTTQSSWCSMMQFAISHKLTYAALSGLIDLVKAHCPPPNNCPSSVYRLKKHFSHLSKGGKHYKFCSSCLEEVEGKSCANRTCCRMKTELCYFSTLPFEKHLKMIYSANWEDLQYPFTRLTVPEQICDIHDGAVIKALMKPGNFLSVPEHTGLLLNTDGVPVFNSSKSSLWPIYLAITSLPPHIRMNCDYLLLAGIWVGPVKPDMKTLLSPVVKGCQQLHSKGIFVRIPDGTKKQVRGKLLLGVFDLPAKATATNMKQFNGEYGCTYCTDKGEVISRNTRIYPPDAPHTTRTPQQMKQWAERAERCNCAVLGVKGESILSQAIQLPECIPIDYMHAILEGVFKSLMKHWFDSSNHGKPYYLGTQKESIDRMVARVKPPMEFRRTPRAIDVASYWKASEYRSWLLYFSVPILKAFLPSEYTHHLALLVCAIHILLGDSITPTSLNSAETMLCTFYHLMPHFYPSQMCTANVHSLIHIVPFVRLWGPLWSYSMFGYENMNGFLKTTFHGTRKMLDQLVFTVTLRQALPYISKQQQIVSTNHDRPNMLQLAEHTYTIGKIRHRKLTSAEKVAIANCAGDDTMVCNTVPAVGRVMKDHVLYHSLMHSTGGARNNCVCMFQTADEQGFAVIDYFCILPSTQPIAVLKVYEHTTSTVLDSILPPRNSELQESNCNEELSRCIIEVTKLSLASRLKATKLSEIKKKCVHIPMKGQSMDYIVVVPNPNEHH